MKMQNIARNGKKKWLKISIKLQIIPFVIFGNNMQPFIAIFGNFCHKQIFGNLVKQNIARNGKKVT